MTQLLTEIIQKTESLSMDEQRTLFSLLEEKLGRETSSASTTAQIAVSNEDEASESSASHGIQSILDFAKKVAENIPAEDLARLPTDGAEQHDHYIYGTPKI